MTIPEHIKINFAASKLLDSLRGSSAYKEYLQHKETLKHYFK